MQTSSVNGDGTTVRNARRRDSARALGFDPSSDRPKSRFPATFADLVSRKAWATIEQHAAEKRDIRREKLFWFPGALSEMQTLACMSLLDRHMAPLLRPVVAPIPQGAISGMRRNYIDSLPKTVRNHSVLLNSRGTRSCKVAARVGLLEMMSSEGTRRLAEVLSGFHLKPDPARQIICYRPGDYVGPHSDHHPEAFNLRNGYVDMHITLSSTSVAHQWLVYENRGLLSHQCQVGVRSGISVSFLPFWHYTTPLIAREGEESDARRWLILTSYTIETNRKGQFLRR